MPFTSFNNQRSPMKRRKSPINRADTAARKRRRAKLAEAKAQRPPTYRDLEKQLRALTATYVKLRDGHTCQQGLADGVICDGIMDAGHIYPSGKFPYFKFEPDNIVCQCRQHNKLHIGRPDVMMCWYQRTRGEEALERLHQRAVSATRPTRDDLLRMIDERTKQIDELRLLAVA